MSDWIRNEYRDASPKRKVSLNKATKKWRENNPDKIKAIRQKTDQKRKQARREKILQEKYGITLQTYLKMLEAQGSKCAICNQIETSLDRHGNLKPLYVDHNHTTGKVRALLCSACNLALGNFKESIDSLLNAVSYLRKHNE